MKIIWRHFKLLGTGFLLLCKLHIYFYFSVDCIYCLKIFWSSIDSKTPDNLQEKVSLNKGIGTEFFSFYTISDA